MRLHSRVRLVSLALVGSVALTAAGLHASPDPPQAAPDLKAVDHVLNRLGFGARPGDRERVQSMGIDAYVELQLHPERIDDQVLEARLDAFETISLSTRDLARDYFRPAQEIRRAEAARAADRARQADTAGQNDPAADDDMNDMMASGEQGEEMTPAEARAQLPEDARRVLANQRTVINELMQAKMLRAALSERQLEEVLVDFWFNHFNVFSGKGQVRQYLTEYERDVIRPHVLGSFRDLLGAVAHSPAMLFYLDNWQSTTPTPAIPPELERRLNDPRLSPEQRRRLMNRVEQRRPQQRQQRGLNENYARELMELHTLGVDGGYTQQDVVELARIFTGWTIDQPRNGGGFVFRQAMHDTGTKTLLGETFGSAGQVEGEHALDLLARHPATARHIAFKLAQRFVADEPPALVVDRAAGVFESTDGDLRAVVRSIVTSPEFMAPEAYRAKVKTPLEFVVSAVRATGAAIVTAQPLVLAMQNLGMPLYGSQPPTGYDMTADAWVSTGSLLNRMNLATALVEGGRVTPAAAPGRRGGAPQVDRPAPPPGRGNPAARARRRGPIQIDVTSLAPDTSDASRDRVVDLLLAGEVSETTGRTLARAESAEVLLALTLGSPEFQRR